MHPSTSWLHDDGTSSLNNVDGGFYDIVLDRIFYKDGRWHTLCLPFAYSGEQLNSDPYLAGADLRTLSSASFQDGTLTLNFTAEGDITGIEAGVPYIVRWPGGAFKDKQNFCPVIIDNTQRDVTCDIGGGMSVTFVGTREIKTFENEDKSVLFLKSGNKLYYPDGNGTTTIYAQRGYFQLNGIEASSPTALKPPAPRKE